MVNIKIDLMTDWLDKKFIEATLRNHVKNQEIVVDKMEVKNACPQGENYGSSLHRVTVNYVEKSVKKTCKLIIKSMPETQMMRNLLNSCSIFEREVKMYSETLPKLQAILDSIGKSDRLVSAVYGTPRLQTIIMEDLKENGFKMAGRCKGLNFDQSCAAVLALAKLHAASFVHYQRNPSSRNEYADTMFVEKNIAIINAIYGPMLAALQAQVKQWPGFEHFADKLHKAVTARKIVELVSHVEPGETRVLLHGDPWTNNFMFKKCECLATLVAIVDFQEVRLASPALDLQYFFNTSLTTKVRNGETNKLLSNYHQEFLDVVTMCGVEEALGEDMKTLKGLKRQMDEKMLFGLKAACITLPIALADDAVDFDSMMKQQAPSNRGNGGIHSSRMFKKVFQELLLKFQRKGFL